VLARRPDALHWFLRLQVDVHGLLVGPADDASAVENAILPIRAQTAKDDQSGAQARSFFSIGCGAFAYLDYSRK
jgi:hypothetical protein